MVLEELYSTKTLKENAFYPLVLGLTHAIFGIATAVLLFPENPTFVAVGITARVLLPTVKRLIGENKTPTNDHHMLHQTYSSFVRVFITYLAIFIGLLVAFGFFSVLLPNAAAHHVFKQQLDLMEISITDTDISFGDWRTLLSINIKVLLISFLASFVDGTGALFILVWNASVWGTIFGAFGKSAAAVGSTDPLFGWMLVLLAVLPHTILEAASYVCGGIAGTILSESTLKYKLLSVKTTRLMMTALHLFGIAVVILVLGALVEGKLTPILVQALFH